MMNNGNEVDSGAISHVLIVLNTSLGLLKAGIMQCHKRQKKYLIFFTYGFQGYLLIGLISGRF